ncbi:MAG: sigma 54-interacting transcriptional regulator [Sorangiineae bacterium]|nr:sigma 54-interacting transcriptional regulator [Sorangiineae bacterium]
MAANLALPQPAPLVPPDELTLEISLAPKVGPWVLEVGSEEGTRHLELREGQRVVIGSGRGAGLRLDDRAVSARHCELVAGTGGLELTDLGARNGVFVGDARVKHATLSGGGSTFVVGRTTIIVHSRDSVEEPSEDAALPGVIGSSAPMRRVAREVRRHARTRAAVLFQGESGTGKDVFARAIHELSGRQGPYLPVNVGAISESLADGELFGYRRGAFTGAVTAHAGAFEQAHRGTLFLDEIAELSPSVQVKLLRVVEDGMVRPVGGSQATRVDVRLVSASWAPLHERVAQGRFRMDLFHRLSVATIALPPLRARRGDIPALACDLLARMRPELGPRRLSSGALARLVSHDWPGNVRELSSALYRAAVASDSADILGEHVQLGNQRTHGPRATRLTVERAAELVRQHSGNISAAAAAAGIARSTFRAWLSSSKEG